MGAMLDTLELDWSDLTTSLDTCGYAVTPPLLGAGECAELLALYGQPDHWRKKIDMARYRFGSGEYQYFSYPLPPMVGQLREAFYPRLATLANAWNTRLGLPERFPDALGEFLEQCHAAGQTRPTPLMLRYQPGDYNCLHQDIYGTHAFPMQVMVMLASQAEYAGGEFLLLENLPRAQSRGTAITLQQGQAVIWPTRYRPGSGSRRAYRIGVKHGVSAVRTGYRHTLGVIFHDAA
jgi:uncharacterized protein